MDEVDGKKVAFEITRATPTAPRLPCHLPRMHVIYYVMHGKQLPKAQFTSYTHMLQDNLSEFCHMHLDTLAGPVC